MTWTIGVAGGLTLVRCAALDSVPGIAHAFGTRTGPGGVPFDAASHATALAEAAGVGRPIVQPLRQVHGTFIATADARPGEADGVLVTLGDRGAAVRSADCVPILVASRDGHAFAAVHAGWRGIAAGIVNAAVDRFEGEGIPPEHLVAAIGPAIRACCYEVGPEVLDALGLPSSRTVDLPAIVAERFTARGVPAAQVAIAPWCTRCRSDLFYSARGEGTGTGRMLSVVGPAGAP
ncbi:MAG TPA: polyphenol oxidase family protein [Candidatus Polarisedimenticolaceae bacterium]|nr:polyphenol oxidase family protein [Candidatus Polarisedimenticolaceae bacterium]